MVRADASAAPEVQYDLGAVSNGMSIDEIRENAHKLYALTPMSLHGYTKRIGMSDLHGVFSLAARHDAIIKCCQGSEEELEGALTAYNRANSIVLELSAIATLCLLGGLDLLKTWARRFVVSQATLYELRRFQFENNSGLLDRTGFRYPRRSGTARPGGSDRLDLHGW